MIFITVCVYVYIFPKKIRVVSMNRKFLYLQICFLVKGFVNLLVYILADILVFHELQTQQILT